MNSMEPITAIGDPMQDPQTATEYEVYCLNNDIAALHEKIRDWRFAPHVRASRDELRAAMSALTDLLMEIDRYAR